MSLRWTGLSKYDHDVALLGELETFDARAFVGDDVWPQELCNAVLAMAVAYNDFKDVLFAISLLREVEPADMQTPTPQLGHFAGLHYHLIRMVAAQLHELADLVRRTKQWLEHPQFLDRVVKHLPAPAREAWIAVLAAAENKPSADPLAMLLVRARNKVAFHYDPEEIGRGYVASFAPGSDREPYLSRGSSMARTRFYFADAAAEAYMRQVTDADTTTTFFNAALPLLPQINHALREVVFRFVTARGYAWRRAAG